MRVIVPGFFSSSLIPAGTARGVKSGAVRVRMNQPAAAQAAFPAAPRPPRPASPARQ